MKVLHVVPSFYPAVSYGGPIFSTFAICSGVSEHEDVTLRVLTTDAASDQIGDRLELQKRYGVTYGNFVVDYCRRTAPSSISLELLVSLPRAISNSDVVHLTGPYSFPVIPTVVLCRLLKKPLIWSPRGGFQATAQWAGAPKKTLKKIFEIFCSVLVPKRTVMHFTADSEAGFSIQRFKKIRTEIIPNSVAIPRITDCRSWDENNHVHVVFLSRLHPKKGLETLLEALQTLPTNFRLSIYGTGDRSYVEKLKGLVLLLQLADRVKFCGHVDGEAKTEALCSADIFCLPTRSENFGIVIAEALACGVPVITTKAAPWAELETRKCGRWVDGDPETISNAIYELSKEDLNVMGTNGRLWMEADYSNTVLSQKMLDVYRDVVNG